MSRILIIEDDIDLQEGLCFSLQTEGHQVMAAATVEEGLGIFHKQGCDMILLDCNLPDGNGFDLCSAIKREQDVPILMLTARDTEMDEVKALELGMDDFMSKPFSLAVLKARIKKLLRKDIPKMQMVSGDIMIDKNSCKVYKGGEEINCSKIEYQMLTYFMENEGIVLSKEQILHYVWDSQGNYVDENAVPVNIRRLRTKIEDDPKNPKHLVNVYGIGYIWKKA
ncbi:response regulator transcription factor [Ruminococcus sp. 5_1_39BFAA]|uniref:response regulator transcription factor n=1 Tax=Ruminococcus sp. 5_1_39BFAA TaxID=457412 RepID=UPI0035616194